MTVVRWDPFRELAGVQDQVNRLFADAYGRRGDEDVMRKGAWVPPVDIYSDPANHTLILKAELPDVAREDIQITVDNNTLTLKGEKRFSSQVKDEQVHRLEIAYGSFSRSFSLPPTVDAEKVAAEYKNGVLTLRLPLKEEAKPKQIQVAVQ